MLREERQGGRSHDRPVRFFGLQLRPETHLARLRLRRYNLTVTYRAMFMKCLGKNAPKKLAPKWERHITRIDALPKPVKVLSPKRVRELLGA